MSEPTTQRPPIIDTHVHLWDPARLTYPWLGDLPILNRAYGMDDYRETTRGIEIAGVVFVQCEALPEQCVAEAQWIDALAREEALIRGQVAYAPLERGEDARRELDALAALPTVRGVRRHLQFEPDVNFCLQADFITGVRALADYGFTFDLMVKPAHLENTRRLVELCPDVTFVLDHLAKPDLRAAADPAGLNTWARDIRALAILPNVACKLSGLITEADPHAWTAQQLLPYIDHVRHCFGAERVMFGGDWPVVRLAGEYRQWFDALLQNLHGATQHELRLLLGRNAARIYRLEESR
jgi:L-fuconolactonase